MFCAIVHAGVDGQAAVAAAAGVLGAACLHHPLQLSAALSALLKGSLIDCCMCRMCCALQGVGKTTACGKLALFLKKRRKKVLLVATDIYRSAVVAAAAEGRPGYLVAQ